MPLKETLKKILPGYMIVPVIILVISNLGIYYGAKLYNTLAGAHYTDMTGVLESVTPVIPAFTLIYVAAFPFWYITYYLLCRKNRELCREIVLTDVVAKLICGILFVLIPTTNIRPDVTGSGPFELLLKLIYASDTPYNLFPSIHCLESWLCFSFIKDSDARVSIKTASFCMAAAICLSTVFTAQHVWIDIFAGILIAEFCKTFVPYLSGVISSTSVREPDCPVLRRSI